MDDLIGVHLSLSVGFLQFPLFLDPLFVYSDTERFHSLSYGIYIFPVLGGWTLWMTATPIRGQNQETGRHLPRRGLR